MAVSKVHRTPVESGRGLCRGLNAKRHFKRGHDNVPYANGDDNAPYANGDDNAPYANGAIGHDSLGLGCEMHFDPISKNTKVISKCYVLHNFFNFFYFLNLKQG